MLGINYSASTRFGVVPTRMPALNASCCNQASCQSLKEVTALLSCLSTADNWVLHFKTGADGRRVAVMQAIDFGVARRIGGASGTDQHKTHIKTANLRGTHGYICPGVYYLALGAGHELSGASSVYKHMHHMLSYLEHEALPACA